MIKGQHRVRSPLQLFPRSDALRKCLAPPRTDSQWTVIVLRDCSCSRYTTLGVHSPSCLPARVWWSCQHHPDKDESTAAGLDQFVPWITTCWQKVTPWFSQHIKQHSAKLDRLRNLLGRLGCCSILSFYRVSLTPAVAVIAQNRSSPNKFTATGKDALYFQILALGHLVAAFGWKSQQFLNLNQPVR